MRKAEMTRQTAETKIKLCLNLDGSGQNNISTGVGFLDHMLELFACHGRFDLDISCEGDLQVDAHHTTEDLGIALGRAFDQALGERRGIYRYGSLALPMDETLVLAAVDISGRGVLVCDLPIPAQKVGDFDTELVKEFLLAFTREIKAAVHLRLLTGENSHHIIEGAFKALARALRQAVAIDPEAADSIPSSKGAIV